jgi:hypothetical protein
MFVFGSLLPGPERRKRPESVFRYTFDHFLDNRSRRSTDLPDNTRPSIVPIEAVAPGDVQVLAAHERGAKAGTPVIALDVLADFPSVESVVASTTVRAGRELPRIKELLIASAGPVPDATTLRRLTGLEALYALHSSPVHGNLHLDLDSLPASQMRKLALSRWLTKSLAPLERMTGLEQLSVDLFRDPLDAISRMTNLSYLRVLGPAKGWATLRNCTMLEEAHLINVQIANLRRWTTWQQLRILTLAGRGVKSLEGLGSSQGLEQLTLLNLTMNDLSPLRELRHLQALTLRMVAGQADLASVAAAPALRSLVIDGTAQGDYLHLPTLKPLALAARLEEVALLDATVDDGDLTPLATLSELRRLRLGSMIGADVDRVRAARPDIALDYTPPDPRLEGLKERIGAVTIHEPREGLEQWFIFQSLALELGLKTNYDAEKRIKNEVKKRDRTLATRLNWDAESGAVGIYTSAEADIRAVAAIVNELLRRG